MIRKSSFCSIPKRQWQSCRRDVTIPSTALSFINREFCGADPEGTESYQNFSPSSGKPICSVQLPTQDQMEEAVAHARTAFSTWGQVPAWERGALLREMATILKQHQAELVELEALDSGLPVTQVEINHIPFAIQTLEYYASLVQIGMEGRIVDTPLAGGHQDSFGYTRREPLGVCLGIGAWNYPLMGMIWKVAPALASGNAMIFKPSESTPLSALHAASIWKDLLPSNILQVLPGDRTVGQFLVNHPDIEKVSITGSIESGIKVAEAAASTLKKVTLELGGKSPLLIFADADMESSVRTAFEGNFINNGEVCSNCTRVFVERSILDDFVGALKEYADSVIRIGDNMQRSTTVGPLIMPPHNPAAHYDRVVGFIDRATADADVDLVYGGKYYEDSGFYCEPTIFIAHSDEPEIVKKEVFGPVMTILPFDSEEEAISRANNSEMGLGAGLMTSDVMRAHRVAKKLVAGTVWINHWNLAPLELPFGPYKRSGYGKELGIEALESYTRTKSVYVEMGPIRESSCFEEIRS